MCSASISNGGTSALTGYSPVSEFSFTLDHLLDSFASCRESTGKQMNEAAAMERYESYTRGESFSLSIFYQIFLGNIMLRYLMRANFPLISALRVFRARHYVSFERVSLLEQLVDTRRIRTDGEQNASRRFDRSESATTRMELHVERGGLCPAMSVLINHKLHPTGETLWLPLLGNCSLQYWLRRDAFRFSRF